MFNPLQSRTLKVACAALPTWGGTDILLPQRVRGVEALGELFKYEVEFASLDSPTFRIYKARELIKPDELIGKTIIISVEFEGKGTFIPGLPGNQGAGNIGAGVRTIEGIITEVEQTGSDERRVYYQFTVRPWLWLASQNSDNRLFQDMSVLDITETVLKGGNYKFPWDMRLARTMLNNNVFPKRDYVRQFWQSDYDFLSQLWSEWGIYYHFDGMTLVLCDSPGSHKKHGNAYDTILYHAPEAERIDEEHIHSLSVSRQITPGEVTLNDYDYTQSNGTFDVTQYKYSKSSRDNIEQYHWGDYTQPLAGAMGLSGQPNDLRNEGNYLAWVRVEALRCEGLRAYGSANARGLMTGRTFQLEGHPQKEVNEQYLVVSTSIDVRNADELAVSPGADAHYHCKTDFVVQPSNAFFKLKPKEKPRAHPETAVVTGPENEPIWLDAYGRVKIFFKWDRIGKKDQNSSCWVRVSLPWHGGPHSLMSVPRIGDEVTIGYHEGDPDKPFVLSSKVNQFNPPPFELPKNMALTGLVSHALEGQGHNYVVTDDTPGKQQVQVASDQANSRLVLGYNTRIVYSDGRQQARGLGWELATDAWGVLRANRGMLVTAETRSGAGSPAMDMGETVQRLTQANEQQDVLAHAAVQAHAQDPQDRLDLSHPLKAQVAELQGQGAASQDAAAVSGPTKPHLLLASAADIAQTAARNVNLHSGEHTAITTGGHFAANTGGNLLASARKAIRFFAYKLGIRMVSYAEDIDVQALKKSINLLAKLEITQTANRITIKASEEVMIHGGDSYISLKSGKITVGGGVYEVNAQAKNLPPKPIGVSPQGLPDVQANDEMFRVLSPTGQPLPGVDYRVQAPSGGHVFRTDAAGRTPLVNTEQAENVKFELHWDEFAAASGRTSISGVQQQ
ncbi:ImpA family type VI secretion-associated protein [Caballeronia novacaledonica]|uniref:ImpA family type VI secretion-associated protein n=1 Tax=Caballeronia novacaledonica TaxID=1544861 RepID=A0A2U3HYW4_9BURK|nr:type VI secretion system Vgr family protein [Caballeronia novacaledonica]SPB12991.1 ImpA family type VI secretion-associated protein [Caballeronia novacaledonica]